MKGRVLPLTSSDRLLVVGGAMLGTGLRYGAFRVWPHVPGSFPTTTLVVNAVGAFLLGGLVEVIAGTDRELMWHWFGRVGVLGGFTTFSAYAIELALYVRDDRWQIGFVYAVAMSTVALVAALAGRSTASDFLARRAGA